MTLKFGGKSGIFGQLVGRGLAAEQHFPKANIR